MQKLQLQLHKIGQKALLHVVPHEDNDHIPHFLRGGALIGFTVVALVAFSAVAWGIPLSRQHGLTAEVYSSVLVDLTNSARKENAMHPLTVSKTLEQVASLKAQDMAAKSYFAHTSPEGLTPWHWFDQAGYKFIYAGENLAVNFDETKDVEAALLASPTHRANILDKNFTEIGIATYPGIYKGMKTTFVVESFGTPTSKAKTAVEVAPNRAPAKAPTVVTAAPTPANVLGESTPEPVAPPSAGPKPEIAVKPVAKTATPIKVVYEDTSTIIAQNATPETELPGVVPDAKPVVVSQWYERFLMNPGPATTTALLLLALIVAIATIAMAAHEVARHHRKHILLGSAFVIFILLLVSFAQQYVFPNLNVIK